MVDTTYIKAFLMQVAVKELALFIGVLLVLWLTTAMIRVGARVIASIFPTKRMGVLNWVPLLNLTIYLGGFCGAAYLIFQPTQELYIGFIVSALIALGFSAKELLQSLVGTIVLLINKPFQVGDRITFQEFYGEVRSISLSSVTLVTLDGNVVTIPSYRFMHDLVSSSSAGELGMMVTVDVFVPSEGVDLSKVKVLLERLAAENAYVNTKQPVMVIVREILSVTGVVTMGMRTKCTVKDARTEQAFQTSFLIDVNKALTKLLRNV